MSPVLRRTCAFAIALLPIPALAQPRVVSRAAGGETPLVVFADAGGLSIDDGAQVARLAVPAGLRIDAAARLKSGWLLAGSRPTDTGAELWISRNGQELSPPAGAARMRIDPKPVLAEGGLAGLAWLEGEGRRQLAVKFAPWGDGAFSAVVEVAPPGPGSQLALSAARLADGTSLLVWSGYDGTDDEIWAAWTTSTGWTAPQRVAADNDVPDITPDLVADGDGALLAWNRFDGSEYELVLARFDGRGFGAPHAVGEPGAVDATFERHPGGLSLLYRDARRSSWAVMELSADAKPARISRWSASAVERPAVQWSAAGPVWTVGARTAATAWE